MCPFVLSLSLLTLLPYTLLNSALYTLCGPNFVNMFLIGAVLRVSEKLYLPSPTHSSCLFTSLKSLLPASPLHLLLFPISLQILFATRAVQYWSFLTHKWGVTDLSTWWSIWLGEMDSTTLHLFTLPCFLFFSLFFYACFYYSFL